MPNIISFPGLGIEGMKIDPVAFRIPLPWVEGGHPIMWYGIIITLAMIVGFSVAHRKAKREGIKSDDMFDLAIYLIIFCILGARLYYVLSKPGQYHSFMDVISIWNGGLAIYGGVIAGVLTIIVYTKIKKINTARLLDAAAPGLILGQAIGRWGNFCNAEAFGEKTDLPWRMGLVIDGISIGEVHPTFLYECLWNLVGFALIMLVVYRFKKFDGQVALFYAVWYGFGRFFIEGLRTDSLYLLENLLGKTVRVSQLVAAVCVVGGVIVTAIGLAKAKRRKLDEAAYESVYTPGAEADKNNSTDAYEIKEADTDNEENRENEAKEN